MRQRSVSIGTFLAITLPPFNLAVISKSVVLTKCFLELFKIDRSSRNNVSIINQIIKFKKHQVGNVGWSKTFPSS